jgi:hypothetical protein
MLALLIAITAKIWLLALLLLMCVVDRLDYGEGEEQCDKEELDGHLEKRKILHAG